MLNPAVLLCGPISWAGHRETLVAAGHRVTVVASSSAAIDQVRVHRPAIVVLDADDPTSDVYDVCRRLRAIVSVPVVTAFRPGADGRIDDAVQLMAFAAGSDDVVPSDISPRVLRARLGALLRRSVAGHSGENHRRLVGPFELDPESRTALLAGTELDLTRIEFDLLGILLERPTRVVPRDELVSRVWGSWFGDDHVVEVHLSRLRAKVVRAGGPRIGVAVRGVGYRLGLNTPIAV